MRPPSYAVFDRSEYEARHSALRARMAERGVDVLIVTTPENIFYLSGYQTPGYYFFLALVIYRDREPVLIPPPHEESLVEALSWVDDYRVYADTSSGIETACRLVSDAEAGRGVVALERSGWFLTANDAAEFEVRLSSATFVDSNGLVEAGRMIKSEAEIAQMREAARVSSAAMSAGLAAARVGAAEREIAAAVYEAQILSGGEYTGLPAFITSGERSMLVHATWSDRVIRHGEVVFLEVPGCINRYHAAHSRVAFTGEPDGLLLAGFTVSSGALEMAKELIRPGIEIASVFRDVKAFIDEADVPYRQGRRIAYGIGTAFPPDWGEGHIVSINADESRSFQPGMAFHIITTMRLPGLGAIGSSDTILVTGEGSETLTSGVPVEIHKN